MNSNFIKSVLWASCLIVAATGCKKSKNEPEPAETAGKYVIATVEGTSPNLKTYFQTAENLNMGTLDTKNATEVALSAVMYNFGKSVYMVTSGPPTMMKYTLNDAGVLTAQGKIVGEGTKTFSKPVFKSESEAYVAVYGQNQLIKFNPTTMQKTGDIDLTALYRKNTAGATTNLFFGGSVIRDDKLFMPIVHERLPLTSLIDSVFVAVFDLKAGKLEKLIRDERSNTAISSGSQVETLIMDENKNIYLQCIATGFNKPSGILRIKAGETEFDKDYFFDLKNTTGISGSYCYGLYYFGKDLAFTSRIDPNATGFSTYSWAVYRIDLANKKVIGAVPGLPQLNAYAGMFVRQFDKNKLIFSVRANNENSLYEYDTNSNTTAKKLTASGSFVGVDILK